MTDENDPFAGLDDTLGEEPDEQRESTESDEGEVSHDTIPDTTTTKDTETDDKNEGLDQPAFPFDDVRQQAFYARPATWNEFEDALDLDVRRALRDRGVRDESKRELHDAVLQVAIEHSAEVATLVEEMRRDGG